MGVEAGAGVALFSIRFSLRMVRPTGISFYHWFIGDMNHCLHWTLLSW